MARRLHWVVNMDLATHFTKLLLLCTALVTSSTLLACASADGSPEVATIDGTSVSEQGKPVKPAADAGTTTTTDSGTTTTTTDSGTPTTRWQPAPGTSWQWQLSGTVDTSINVSVYDIDLFDNTASTISGLKARGVKVVCYLSAGSYENWRPDAAQFPAVALGKALSGWAGERWLDVRNTTVRSIMQARMDLAVQKGCSAVEADNVDGFANTSGFALTSADQLDYNRFLASEAHARGLSIALKNDLGQVSTLVADFDFAIVEECFKYNECAMTTPFISAGKAVFEVEYGSTSLASSICPAANGANLDTLIKNLSLDAPRTSCR